MSSTRIEEIQRAFNYDAWANARLRSCLAATDGDERELALWNHLAASKRIWLARVLGEDVDGQVVWPTLTVSVADGTLADAETGWRSFLADLPESELSRVVTFHNTLGEPQADALADILHHVPLHSAHHRGQLAALARSAGTPIASFDFILFAREQNKPPGDSRKLPVSTGRARIPAARIP
ncbi:MAG: DinB family protein [Planctomycetes bacterium]|nr:DinB family protein [Planctomycetota bacterium]